MTLTDTGVLVKYSVKFPSMGISQTLHLWLDEVVGFGEERAQRQMSFSSVITRGAC